MLLKRNDNKVVYSEIVQPEYVLAEFTDTLTDKAKADFVDTHNEAMELREVYKMYRDSQNIYDIGEMLQLMEAIYFKYKDMRDD